LNRFRPADRRKAVQDFLQHLRIGYQARAIGDAAFQETLGIYFMCLRGSDKVHRDAGIDEYHGIIRYRPPEKNGERLHGRPGSSSRRFQRAAVGA
jgi:hypothetical protein